MTKRTFLLVDSVLLDALGVAAIAAGWPIAAAVLFGLAAVALAAFFLAGRSRVVASR